MKLSRKSIQKGQENLKKDAISFIEGADDATSNSAQRGRPRENRELTKPTSISLTATERKKLDHQAKRFNMMDYQNDIDTTIIGLTH